jgi:exo-beta-1,3-glucanase (GH17 family)
MAGPRRTSSAGSMDAAALNSSNSTDAHSGSSSSSSSAAPSAATTAAAAAAAAKKKKAGLVKQMSAREVRTRLRQLGKPITLYGETDSERSARLVAAEAEEHNDDFNLGAGHETR